MSDDFASPTSSVGGGRFLSLREEMAVYLDQIARPGRHKARNVAMVESFYGFGRADWPTLASVGQRFGVTSRERVRQILNADFRSTVCVERLTRLQTAARLLASRSFWFEVNYLESLSEVLGAAVETSSAGLLSLFHDLGLAEGYALFDLNLERLNPRRFSSAQTRVIVSAEKTVPLRTSLKRALALSNCAGLVNTATLRAASGAHFDELKTLLRLTPGLWCSGEDDDFWFCAPSEDSVLFRLIGKIFAVTDELAADALARALHAGLWGVTHRRPRPDVEIIERWLRQASGLTWRNNSISGALSPAALTCLEQAIVRHLADREWSLYSPIKADLLRQGFEESTFAKLLTQSPLVEVDRSGGLKAHRYRLVGAPRGVREGGC